MNLDTAKLKLTSISAKLAINKCMCCSFVFQESDLLALLRQEQDEEEEHVQSTEISNADLEVALDRQEMVLGRDECLNQGIPVLALKGPGWEEVIQGGSDGNLLTSIEGYRKVAPTTVAQ